MAARLAEVFHQDPIDLLDCDEVEWMLRLACAKVIANDHEEARREREANNSSLPY